MNSILDRLSEKIEELGNQKVLLTDQLSKLRQENEELSLKLVELEASKMSSSAENNTYRGRSIKINDDIMVTTSRDIISAIAAGKGPEQFLIALGYAGWGDGQLESEMRQNAWLAVPADKGILFEYLFFVSSILRQEKHSRIYYWDRIEAFLDNTEWLNQTCRLIGNTSLFYG